MDCIFCWQYNALYPRQVVEIKNRKYCNLYPKYQKQAKKQVPNFDHCKISYTKCDYLYEKCVQKYIIKLEWLFKEYEELLKQEVEMQKGLIEDMWLQSQRYLLLTRSGVCVQPYPEIVSLPTEQRALCRFYTSLRKINISNCLLNQSMENIQACQCELNICCKQLDMTVQSPFLNGSYFLNSLSYIRNSLNDLLDYFYSKLCKMKCWAQLLDPGDSVSIEDYTSLIKSNKENDVTEILSNCYCLRTKNH